MSDFWSSPERVSVDKCSLTSKGAEDLLRGCKLLESFCRRADEDLLRPVASHSSSNMVYIKGILAPKVLGRGDILSNSMLLPFSLVSTLLEGVGGSGGGGGGGGEGCGEVGGMDISGGWFSVGKLNKPPARELELTVGVPGEMETEEMLFCTEDINCEGWKEKGDCEMANGELTGLAMWLGYTKLEGGREGGRERRARE